MAMKSFHCPLLKSQKNQGFGRAYRSSFRNSRGQAMIEYLLVVVVSITLLSTLAIAVFKPLGNFVDALNRVYIQCLLETGELPGLKNGSSTECAAQMPQWGDAAGGDSSTGGGQGAGKGSAKNSTDNADTSGSGASDAEDTAGGRTAASNINRKTSVISNGIRNQTSSRGEAGAKASTTIPVEQFEEGNGFMNLSSPAAEARRRAQKTKQIALSGLIEAERKKIEREAQKVSSVPVNENESFTLAQKKKVIVKPPPERKIAEEENVNMEFGFYFKIFFMIIIILFIIILLGGQAMQISKNWE